MHVMDKTQIPISEMFTVIVYKPCYTKLHPRKAYNASAFIISTLTIASLKVHFPEQSHCIYKGIIFKVFTINYIFSLKLLQYFVKLELHCLTDWKKCVFIVANKEAFQEIPNPHLQLTYIIEL